MSTQINVVVDGGGLVDRSKEQTQANRWAKAEADARQATLQEGLRQRVGRLQQDGRAPDGGPLYGSATDARARLDEPTAQRSTPTVIGHIWFLRDAQRVDTENTEGVFWRNFGGWHAQRGTPEPAITASYEWSGITGLSGTGARSVQVEGPGNSTGGSQYPTVHNDTFTDPQVSGYYTGVSGLDGIWTVQVRGMRRGSIRRQSGYIAGYSWHALPVKDDTFIMIGFFRRAGYELDGTAFCVIADGLQYPGPYSPTNTVPDDVAAQAIQDAKTALHVDNTSTMMEPFPGDRFPTLHMVSEEPGQTRIKAFVCNNRGIREISVPSYFDSYNPPIGRTTYTWSTGNPALSPSVEVPDLAASAPYQSLPSARTPGFGDTSGPLIYKSLNDIKPFTSALNIKQTFPYASIAPQQDKGAYLAVGFNRTDLYEQALPLLYKYQKTFAEPYQDFRDSGLKLSGSRPAVPSSNIPGTEVDLRFVSDWGDPEYCRQMLLELGFSPADLTP